MNQTQILIFFSLFLCNLISQIFNTKLNYEFSLKSKSRLEILNVFTRRLQRYIQSKISSVPFTLDLKLASNITPLLYCC